MERLTLCDWTCQQCNKRKWLEVHHRYYIRGRDPWDYPDDALMPLCEDCHEAAGLETEHLGMALSCLPLGMAEELACALDRIIDSAADANELSLRLESWLACTATFDLCLKALAIKRGEA